VGWGSFDFLKNTIVKEKEVNNMRTLEIFAKSGKQKSKILGYPKTEDDNQKSKCTLDNSKAIKQMRKLNVG
jgi:hypothetical protein